MTTYLDQSLAQLEIFEGRSAWMYLDTVGKVTVGVGQMLPTLASALALPFMIDGLGGDSPAEPGDIERSWTRLAGMKPGMPAAHYGFGGAVHLEESTIDALLRKVVAGLDAKMPDLYPAYDSWPDAAKLAVLDMEYNLGSGGLADYHQMNAALNANPPNWKAAAADCHRKGPSQVRNAWTANQFASIGA